MPAPLKGEDNKFRVVLLWFPAGDWEFLPNFCPGGCPGLCPRLPAAPKPSPSLAQSGVTLSLLGREPERLQLQRKTEAGAGGGAEREGQQILGGLQVGERARSRAKVTASFFHASTFHPHPPPKKRARGAPTAVPKKGRDGRNTPPACLSFPSPACF